MLKKHYVSSVYSLSSDSKSGRLSRERKRALTYVERGGMQPPSQHSARFAVETRWKMTCVVERPALFWIGSSQGLYNFKLGKEIILCLVLHFANPACFRSH